MKPSSSSSPSPTAPNPYSRGTYNFATWLDAHAEAVRRRSDPIWKGFVNQIESSPYGGGYLVRSLPVEMWVEAKVASTLIGRPVNYEDL